MQNKEKNGMSSNLIFSVLIKLFMYLLPLITAPYLARVLGANGIGEYTYANSIVSYFTLLVNFGFVGYGTIKISANRNNKEVYSGNFWSIVFSRGILLIIASLLYSILLLVFYFYLNISISIYLILFLTIFVNFFDVTYLFQGIENFKIISIINLIVRSLSVVSLFIFVKSIDDLYTYVWIQVIQVVTIALLPWIFVKNRILKPNKEYINLKSTFKSSFYYFLPTLAVTLCSLVDKTMLGNLSSKKEVAYYEQADKLIIMVIGILHSFAPVYASRVSLLVKEQREEEISHKIDTMSRLYFIISIPAIFGLYLISKYFIPTFYGDEFSPSINVIYFLIPLIFFKSITNALGNVYYGPRGKIWMTSIFYAIGGVLNIITNIFMIRKYGAVGAAITSLISEFIIFVLFILFSRSKIKYISLSKNLVKPIISSGLMFIAIYFTNEYFLINKGIDYLFIVLIDFGIGIIIYGVVILLLREKLVLTILNKFLNIFLKRG